MDTPLSPCANAIAESFIGTTRRESPDHLLILGRRHLERVLDEFVEHHREARPHQGLGQRRPCEPVDLASIAPGRWNVETIWAGFSDCAWITAHGRSLGVDSIGGKMK